MKSNPLFVITFITSVCFSTLSQAEVLVIVNESSALTTVKYKELRRLYLGKSDRIGGQRFETVNLPDKSNTKVEFDHFVLNKNADKMQSYWAKRIFAGKGHPGETLSDDDAVVQWVSKSTGRIGYVSDDARLKGIKVVATVPFY